MFPSFTVLQRSEFTRKKHLMELNIHVVGADTRYSTDIASFLGPTCFHLPFSIYNDTQDGPGSIHHVNDVRWMQVTHSDSVYYCECKQKIKTGEVLEQGKC